MAAQSSQESLDRLHKLLESASDAKEKKMFGIYGVVANGYTFVYLNGDTLVFKLNDEDSKSVVVKGATIYNPSGKIPMNGFYVLPESVLSDESQLNELFQKAYQNVMSMPMKEPKKKKSKKETE